MPFLGYPSLSISIYCVYEDEADNVGGGKKKKKEKNIVMMWK